MPFIPAVNTAKVTIVQRMHDQVITNGIYVQSATAWDQASLEQLAGTVRDWWEDDLAPDVSVNLSLDAVIARDLTTAESMGVEVTVNPPITGGIVAQGAPANVALAIKLLTAMSGRNRRGRIFQSGIAEDDTNGNQITSSRRDAFVTDYMGLRDDITALGHTWVVASFYDGTALSPVQPDGTIKKVPVPRATALLTPITNVRADIDFDSQRRRLTGRGA